MLKQHLSDQLRAMRGAGAQVDRVNRLTGEPSRTQQSSTSFEPRSGAIDVLPRVLRL